MPDTWEDGRIGATEYAGGDGDESASRCVRAKKNKCKCAGVSDHLELSTNTMIGIVRVLKLFAQSVQ